MTLYEGERCSEWVVEGWTSAGDCCLRPTQQGILAAPEKALLTVTPSGRSILPSTPPDVSELLSAAADSLLRTFPKVRKAIDSISIACDKLGVDIGKWTADVRLELHYADGSHRTATSENTTMDQFKAGPLTCTESGAPDRPHLIRIKLWTEHDPAG
ncbi:hypothetical protein [Streptomyces sp. Je 1-369]|uniref:hypothetical protein n=1 Tax=Streptomyces sp. Je 1-369 TaxID=2966192 RepID=UPI00228564DF|nr:hypothetical protein [Streptomyces sp. Je 1-369]WAL93225.1 hypothetical protein NOO62_01155 [Streptomyces sp. Je 1-369]